MKTFTFTALALASSLALAATPKPIPVLGYMPIVETGFGLYAGSGTGKIIGTPYSSSSACAAAALMQAKTAGVYLCKNTATVNLVTQPVGSSQTVACPPGYTGSWQQTRAYGLQSGVWTLGPWLPVATPDGACTVIPVPQHPGRYVDLSKAMKPVTGYPDRRIAPYWDSGVAGADIGAFRLNFGPSHMAYDDPIVYSGLPGKSHFHTFFGNTLTDFASTADSILNSGNSTSAGGIINRTAYWVPTLLDTTDGNPLVPLSISVYYKTGYNGVQNKDVVPFPAGLRMIAGNKPMQTNEDTSSAYWTCGTGGSQQRYGHVPLDCGDNSGLLMGVDFPQCWDGKNLDSPDHRSHMAYANSKYITQAQLDIQMARTDPPAPGFNGWGLQWWQSLTTMQGCPADHPVALPAISYGIWYQGMPHAADNVKFMLSSDADNSPGFSGHGDWFGGWEADIMQAIVTNCLNAAKDCHDYLTGDGRILYQDNPP